MAFIQFLERMNELGGDEIKERDCDEWFWKCDDENIQYRKESSDLALKIWCILR